MPWSTAAFDRTIKSNGLPREPTRPSLSIQHHGERSILGNLFLVRKVTRAACQARTVRHVVKRLAARLVPSRAEGFASPLSALFFLLLLLFPFFPIRGSNGEHLVGVDEPWWGTSRKRQKRSARILAYEVDGKVAQVGTLGSCSEILKRDRNLSPLVTRNSPSNLHLTRPRRKSSPRYLI